MPWGIAMQYIPLESPAHLCRQLILFPKQLPDLIPYIEDEIMNPTSLWRQK